MANAFKNESTLHVENELTVCSKTVVHIEKYQFLTKQSLKCKERQTAFLTFRPRELCQESWSESLYDTNCPDEALRPKRRQMFLSFWCKLVIRCCQTAP